MLEPNFHEKVQNKKSKGNQSFHNLSAGKPGPASHQNRRRPGKIHSKGDAGGLQHQKVGAERTCQKPCERES